jgi:hypothetical protein
VEPNTEIMHEAYKAELSLLKLLWKKNCGTPEQRDQSHYCEGNNPYPSSFEILRKYIHGFTELFP